VPNVIAFAAMAFWLPFTIVLFFIYRPTTAMLIALLGAMMFLPEKTEIHVPGYHFFKDDIAHAGVLIGVILRARKQLKAAKPFSFPDWFLLIMAMGAIGTAMTNTDVLYTVDEIHNKGRFERQALGLDEGFAVMFIDIGKYLIPFVLGRALVRTRVEMRILLASYAIGVLVYLPFIMVEKIASPQWHLWIYGFHQHEFIQSVRDGEYRPMVFMAHGLAVAIFLCTAVLGLAVMIRDRTKLKGVPKLPAVPAFVIVFLFLLTDHSSGSLIFAIMFLPIVFFFSAKMMARVVVLVSMLTILYPVIRVSKMLPETALILTLTDMVGSARAASMAFRFTNEAQISERAMQRPWYGWGRFDRSAVYIWVYDQAKKATTVDGQWVVLLGGFGIVGFVGFFGTLFWTSLSLWLNLKKIKNKKDQVVLAGLGVMFVVMQVDMIPNGYYDDMVMVLGGAILGLLKGLPQEAVKDAAAAAAQAEALAAAEAAGAMSVYAAPVYEPWPEQPVWPPPRPNPTRKPAPKPRR
jgi:uncharacterized membrane protein YkvA (DUF1232 family)